METYLQSIRSSAVSILNGSRAWDGGIFQLLGEKHMLYTAVANRSLDRRLIVSDAKSTLLSGGSLTAIVFTALLVIALIALIIASIFCRCRRPATNSKSKFPLSSKLQLRASRVSQLPITLRRLLGIVSVLVLLMALVPLMLSFAANSRLHASVSDSQSNRDGTIANQIKQSFDHVETFLANLIPAARRDTQPVIRWTLDMTAAMKNKSQSAYQHAFRKEIGANALTDSSTDLLDRMGLYYYTGMRLGGVSQEVSQALNNLKNVKLYAFEKDCRSYVGSEVICGNHTESIKEAQSFIEQVYDNWTNSNPHPQGILNNVTNFLRDFVGTLDGTNNSPEAQQRLKEQKLNVSIEFNRNISSVFDRELNSTEFVLSGLEQKFTDLTGKIDNAIGSLRNTSARVQAGYAASSSRFESMRFGATTALLVLLLLTLVLLSTETVLIQMPSVAKTRSGILMGGVYTSYVAYALAIVFVCLMFCLTGYLQTEACRYLYEERTADRFLVPEINAIVRELKARAAANPNATTAIPLNGVGRLIGGILEGCRENQPILKALDAVGYIDTEASNSAEASLQFKQKGRDILRREMSNANLEVLRDTSMGDKMRSLRQVFVKYRSFLFASLGRILEQKSGPLTAAHRVFLMQQELNSYIQSHINNTEDSTWKVADYNRQNIQTSLEALQTLMNTTAYFVPKMEQLEAKKDVLSVINTVIESNSRMDVYLANSTLWTETAVMYYTMYVIDGSAAESKAIADNTTVEFLSALAPCRDVYNFYQAVVGIPCRSVMYPLSILWFCIAWFLWFAVLLALLVHLSLANFTDPSSQQQQQQNLPLDDKYRASNGDQMAGPTTTATEDGGATAEPLLKTAATSEAAV